MTEHIALVGSGTGGTVLANTLAEKFRSEIDAGEDETRRAIQVPLRALGGADTNGPVGRRDLWDGLRDGEFPSASDTSYLSAHRSAERYRPTEN